MNNSGRSVSALSKSLGIPTERIIVIADEVHLPVGKIRVRGSGSSAGHNGHKSIIAALGSSEYPRVRIGIGASEAGAQIDHVLSGFEPEEQEIVRGSVQNAADAVEIILSLELTRAMEMFNGKQNKFDD